MKKWFFIFFVLALYQSKAQDSTVRILRTESSRTIPKTIPDTIHDGCHPDVRKDLCNATRFQQRHNSPAMPKYFLNVGV